MKNCLSQLAKNSLLLLTISTINADSIKAQKTDNRAYRIHRNTLKIATGVFYMPGWKGGLPTPFPKYISFYPPPFTQSFQTIGGYYERKVYKNWNIGGGYMQWKALFQHKTGNPNYEVGKPTNKVGDIEYR